MPVQPAVGLRVITEILNARSVTDISHFFVFPMPTQVGPHLHIYRTAEELAQGYSALAQSKAQKGQSLFQPRIAAVELPRNNRFRVWVDWLYTDQHGNPCTGDRSIYFCSTLRGHTAVEMIQCQPRTPALSANTNQTLALA